MKVLMLGWELPPYNSGGLGVACLNLSKALAKDGAEIDFVVPYTAPTETETDFMNVVSATKIKPEQKFGLSGYDSQNYTLKPKDKKAITIRKVQKDYCKFIKKRLMDFKPDVIHAHDWLTFEAGVLAKKNYGVPLVAHVHATEFDRSGRRGGNPLVEEIERNGLMLADKIIAVSNATKQIIVDKYGIPAEKIDVIYNSLDANFAKKTYKYDEKDYCYLEEMKNRGYTIISTVGRFTVQKGLKNFIKAAALAISKNPKLIFVLAGDGEQRNELLKLTAEYGISKNVVFTGFVRGKQLRDMYAVSDVFVMSSVSEPFGLTALEAAHHDNALILTKQSGVHEIIRSVMVYDFWDIDKLANEMLELASGSALKSVLKQNMRLEYANISWDDVAKRVETIYNKLDNHKD
ncbi:glycosyltransferase family 4 protein [Candidatus Saccharibacteria bacterium]|nr:glycosyltransferase family 4 protein [Candidatus Saccharibacteria bacterium]